MKAKATVQLAGCTFQLGYAAAVMETAYRNAGAELVLTSARDSVHGTGSLHYTGNAIDGRTRNLSLSQGNKILAQLKAELESLGFDVIDERGKPGAPHFHVEFQLKPGERFIEIVP